ncbi:MAG: hypothetical protein AAF220_12720, partial [Pseudomonadota bacterium]
PLVLGADKAVTRREPSLTSRPTPEKTSRNIFKARSTRSDVAVKRQPDASVERDAHQQTGKPGVLEPSLGKPYALTRKMAPADPHLGVGHTGPAGLGADTSPEQLLRTIEALQDQMSALAKEQHSSRRRRKDMLARATAAAGRQSWAIAMLAFVLLLSLGVNLYFSSRMITLGEDVTLRASNDRAPVLRDPPSSQPTVSGFGVPGQSDDFAQAMRDPLSPNAGTNNWAQSSARIPASVANGFGTQPNYQDQSPSGAGDARPTNGQPLGADDTPGSGLGTINANAAEVQTNGAGLAGSPGSSTAGTGVIGGSGDASPEVGTENAVATNSDVDGATSAQAQDQVGASAEAAAEAQALAEVRAQAEQQANALAAQLAQIQRERDALQSALRSSQSRVSQLQAGSQNADQKIDGLETQVETLQRTVRSLSATLSGTLASSSTRESLEPLVPAGSLTGSSNAATASPVVSSQAEQQARTVQSNPLASTGTDLTPVETAKRTAPAALLPQNSPPQRSQDRPQEAALPSLSDLSAQSRFQSGGTSSAGAPRALVRPQSSGQQPSPGQSLGGTQGQTQQATRAPSQFNANPFATPGFGTNGTAATSLPVTQSPSIPRQVLPALPPPPTAPSTLQTSPESVASTVGRPFEGGGLTAGRQYIYWSQEGDTILTISRQVGISANALLRANAMTLADADVKLPYGTGILVPDRE